MRFCLVLNYFLAVNVHFSTTAERWDSTARFEKRLPPFAPLSGKYRCPEGGCTILTVSRDAARPCPGSPHHSTVAETVSVFLHPCRHLLPRIGKACWRETGRIGNCHCARPLFHTPLLEPAGRRFFRPTHETTAGPRRAASAPGRPTEAPSNGGKRAVRWQKCEWPTRSIYCWMRLILAASNGWT